MIKLAKVEKRAIYMCDTCKNVVEGIYSAGGPIPECCGDTMTELKAQTADVTKEKHVPYIEKKSGGVLVKVGKETAHPMTAEHYIVFIEIEADGILMRKYLNPGDAPEAFFKTDAKHIVAWEYCNLHKYWKSP
ncbi:superoxide reductase [Candidatus Methanoplasma termitum]|uniref:SorA protein n=1 Tax=Candidatus Methanoplasma termitum TaxID=1577791 RepID=A0A0A7LD12_9ARCH|nr:desulfoferrodoxin family protein [Candidatus Methanoplasma termitum]AIZ56172.1 superoxide reductase [Candidatus Methanoplasma termitum]